MMMKTREHFISLFILSISFSLLIDAGSIGHNPNGKFLELNEEQNEFVNGEILLRTKDPYRFCSNLLFGNDEIELIPSSSSPILRPPWKRSKLNLHTNLNLPRYL